MEIGVGEGGLQNVTLQGAGKSKVVVYSFGAHVTSWIDASGVEKIYTSPTAIYNGTKAIRGGIPVCFPQFAKHGGLKQHGFARTSVWAIDDEHADFAIPSVRFVLCDTPETRSSAWPHAFKLALTVSLVSGGNALSLSINVYNLQKKPFDFTFALHSYFTCDSESVTLSEYDGIKYSDSIDDAKEKTQSGDISFGKEIDRVYITTPDVLTIPQSPLTITKSNMPEAVVWNPFTKKAAALADLPDDGWKNFICIEPARVMEPAQVLPEECWSASLILSSK
eukprot:IDg1187t1